MVAQESIEFVLLSNSASYTEDQAQMVLDEQAEANVLDLKSNNLAIVGKELFTQSSQTVFEEEAVEVEDLFLTHEQRLCLYAHNLHQHFTEDAWLAIGANLVCQQPDVHQLKVRSFQRVFDL